MNVNMIEISKKEYKNILELAYKAAMLKEAILNSATLDFYGKGLYFGGGNEIAAIFKYAFPEDYDVKLRELMAEENKKAKEAEDDER